MGEGRLREGKLREGKLREGKLREGRRGKGDYGKGDAKEPLCFYVSCVGVSLNPPFLEPTQGPPLTSPNTQVHHVLTHIGCWRHNVLTYVRCALVSDRVWH